MALAPTRIRRIALVVAVSIGTFALGGCGGKDATVLNVTAAPDGAASATVDPQVVAAARAVIVAGEAATVGTGASTLDLGSPSAGGLDPAPLVPLPVFQPVAVVAPVAAAPVAVVAP